MSKITIFENSSIDFYSTEIAKSIFKETFLVYMGLGNDMERHLSITEANAILDTFRLTPYLYNFKPLTGTGTNVSEVLDFLSNVAIQRLIDDTYIYAKDSKTVTLTVLDSISKVDLITSKYLWLMGLDTSKLINDTDVDELCKKFGYFWEKYGLETGVPTNCTPKKLARYLSKMEIQVRDERSKIDLFNDVCRQLNIKDLNEQKNIKYKINKGLVPSNYVIGNIR